MLLFDLARVRTVLCLGAHPDDIEIGCGGTLRQLLRDKPDVEVYWVVLSGTVQRHREAQVSAERYLGKIQRRTVEVKHFRDRFFPFDGCQLKEYFLQLASRCDPDLIFTHRREDLHQDHRLVAELTWNSFRRQTIFEYEIPKFEGDLGHPNVYFPVSKTVCQHKIDALLQDFPTQQEKPWFSQNTFWALLRLRGIEAAPPSEFAEAFTCRKLSFATDLS